MYFQIVQEDGKKRFGLFPRKNQIHTLRIRRFSKQIKGQYGNGTRMYWTGPFFAVESLTSKGWKRVSSHVSEEEANQAIDRMSKTDNYRFNMKVTFKNEVNPDLYVWKSSEGIQIGVIPNSNAKMVSLTELASGSRIHKDFEKVFEELFGEMVQVVTNPDDKYYGIYFS